MREGVVIIPQTQKFFEVCGIKYLHVFDSYEVGVRDGMRGSKLFNYALMPTSEWKRYLKGFHDGKVKRYHEKQILERS